MMNIRILIKSKFEFQCYAVLEYGIPNVHRRTFEINLFCWSENMNKFWTSVNVKRFPMGPKIFAISQRFWRLVVDCCVHSFHKPHQFLYITILIFVWNMSVDSSVTHLTIAIFVVLFVSFSLKPKFRMMLLPRAHYSMLQLELKCELQFTLEPHLRYDECDSKFGIEQKFHVILLVPFHDYMISSFMEFA